MQPAFRRAPADKLSCLQRGNGFPNPCSTEAALSSVVVCLFQYMLLRQLLSCQVPSHSLLLKRTSPLLLQCYNGKSKTKKEAGAGAHCLWGARMVPDVLSVVITCYVIMEKSSLS